MSELHRETPTRRPDVRFLLAHPAHCLACGFGSGLSPLAPGTVGTALAWALFPWLSGAFSPAGLWAVLAVAGMAGVWICHIAGQALGEVDHSCIVWDEMVPFWCVLALTPSGWGWQLAAFLLFRFFDIVKWPPANYFNDKVKNGFGVMMDDVIAAVQTLVVLALAYRLWNAFVAR